MDKDYYNKHCKLDGPPHPSVKNIAPPDAVRLTEHTPCFMCGTARGACRHRTAW